MDQQTKDYIKKTPKKKITGYKKNRNSLLKTEKQTRQARKTQKDKLTDE